MTRGKCGVTRLSGRRARAVHKGASNLLEVKLTH